jgi:hypothetical protein
MILESICLGHIIAAGVLVGIFFLVNATVPMPPIEKNLMQTDARGNTIVIQMKESVHHGSNEQEAIASHQESSAL